jgi:hypothetical protein
LGTTNPNLPLDPEAPEFCPQPPSLSVGQIQFKDTSLYMTGKIAGISTSMLLDTGAARTIVSSSLWEEGGGSSLSSLGEVDGSLHSATGENLKILGITDITLQLGSLSFNHPTIVVENLTHPCLLGSDFFSAHNCNISFQSATLSVGDTEIPLRQQSEEPKICRVVLGKTTRIPANTEMIVPGRLVTSSSKNHMVHGLVDGGNGHRNFVTGRSLVSTDHGKVPVRIANFTDKSISI